MIKLNRITDYAIVVMAAMGRDLAGMHTAQALARDTAVPLPTVSKVLKQLARDGLIVSHRGAAGGYTLGRPPGAITTTTTRPGSGLAASISSVVGMPIWTPITPIGYTVVLRRGRTGSTSDLERFCSCCVIGG